MLRKYLNALILFLFFIPTAFATVNLNPLYVSLSDAMEAVKQNDIAKSQQNLTAFKDVFEALPEYQSEKGQQVSVALAKAQRSPTLADFEQLSKALYAFEKEQNPVDYTQKRQQFVKRVMPVYEQLKKATYDQNVEEAQTSYKRFNSTWTLNEKVVRETSLGHYGQIETAMTYYRIAMLSEPVNFAEMTKQADVLGEALHEFKAGKTRQPQTSTIANAPQTLPEGIALLEQSYADFSQNQTASAQEKLKLFIQQWPIFEGDVRTRDSDLYTKIESDLPLIMLKGNEPQTLAQLHALIGKLNELDVSGNYTAFDAMLILVREGLEALLIILALLTALNAANQTKAKRYVYAGAGLGLGASVLGAIALQTLFPTVAAGTNREILEGVVGIIAVLTMVFIGAWLHSKSSVQGWKKFIDKQVTQAVATGSLVSMLFLSFLAVFREGAETLLFYAGMLPMMALQDFLLGITLALIALAILTVLMNNASQKLPMHHLFKAMTWLIYLLGFKILGVSIHALQLTSVLSTHLVEVLPNIPLIGFYANIEGMIAQFGYTVLAWWVAKLVK